jgi:uncharacterized protein (TIGR03067 family)
MRSIALVVALWLIPVVATAASPGDELNGKWQFAAMELRGMQLPAEAIGPLKLAVLELGNGKLTIRAGDRVLHEGQYTVNAQASPKTIEGNLTPQTRRRKKAPESSTGIYEVEGDVLRVCIGAPGGGRPPRTFTTAGPGGGTTLLVYQRVK